MGIYEVRVRGQLDETWSAWFDGLRIVHEDHGETSLRGWVRDQAALHGLLTRVRDLGLDLVAVNRIGAGAARPAPSGHAELDEPARES